MIDIMVGYVWCYILYINLTINNRFKKPNGFIIYIFKTSFFFLVCFLLFCLKILKN